MASCLLLLTHAGPASAQPSGVAVPVQGLRFGTLVPGTLTQVLVTDNLGRAAIEVLGGGQVTVTFGLPPGLRTSAGEFLPLRFGPGDGQIVVAGTGRIHNFDPRMSYGFTLPPGRGQARIFLGGSALPESTQRPGSYEGEVTVTIVISNGNT